MATLSSGAWLRTSSSRDRSPFSVCSFCVCEKSACTGAVKPARRTWKATRSPTVMAPFMMKADPSPRTASCAARPSSAGAWPKLSV